MEAANVGSLPVSTQGGLHVNWNIFFQCDDPKQAIADYYADMYSLDTVDILAEGSAESDAVSAWKQKMRGEATAEVQKQSVGEVAWNVNAPSSVPLVPFSGFQQVSSRSSVQVQCPADLLQHLLAAGPEVTTLGRQRVNVGCECAW